MGPNLCCSSGNTSPVWPGYACLKMKKKLYGMCKGQRGNIKRKRLRSAHHKCTSSRWKCEAGSCASGFFAANVQIPNISINTILDLHHRVLMKMFIYQKFIAKCGYTFVINIHQSSSSGGGNSLIFDMVRVSSF